MKILHIIASMNPEKGGVAQAVRNIIFNNTYYIHEVVCMDDVTVDYGSQDGFVLHKIGKGKSSYQYSPRLKKWIKNNIADYTHVIVHGIWQYHNFAAFQVLKGIRKEQRPILAIMPHGMLDPYFQKDTSRRWKAIRNEIVWRITEKKAINAADALLFTCEEEIRLARTTFKGYHPKKELNVGLGVATPPELQHDMTTIFQKLVATGTNYWLFLSRIHPKKGIDLLIDAYNQLSLKMESIPDLVIAGPTDSDYAQQMIEKAKNNPKIHFSGMLTNDAKWGAFYGCRAYLLPSHQENFGIAIVEAMACKKPVLITKHINIWREIEAGKGGWILDELSVSAIENHLMDIARLNNQQLEKIGQQAYHTFEQNFSIEERARIFVKMIKEI